MIRASLFVYGLIGSRCECLLKGSSRMCALLCLGLMLLSRTSVSMHVRCEGLLSRGCWTLAGEAAGVNGGEQKRAVAWCVLLEAWFVRDEGLLERATHRRDETATTLSPVRFLPPDGGFILFLNLSLSGLLSVTTIPLAAAVAHRRASSSSLIWRTSGWMPWSLAISARCRAES